MNFPITAETTTDEILAPVKKAKEQLAFAVNKSLESEGPTAPYLTDLVNSLRDAEAVASAQMILHKLVVKGGSVEQQMDLLLAIMSTQASPNRAVSAWVSRQAISIRN